MLTGISLKSFQIGRNKGDFHSFIPGFGQIYAYFSLQSMGSFGAKMPMFPEIARHLFWGMSLIFPGIKVLRARKPFIFLVYSLQFV